MEIHGMGSNQEIHIGGPLNPFKGFMVTQKEELKE